MREDPGQPIPRDVRLRDGRTLRMYDTGGDGFAVVWHHGSPQTGIPPAPLVAATAERGLRLLSYGRPSYGGSSPDPGRTVASAAADVAQLADAAGVSRFAVMGASGGGPHALACAALLPGRVTAAACLGGVAPYTEDFDWFAGMITPGGLRAARAGRAARARYAETATFDENSFTPADHAALAGDWESLGADAGRAGAAGPEGQIDDDVAFAGDWGFAVTEIDAPVLIVHGGEDRVVPVAHGGVAGAPLPAAGAVAAAPRRPHLRPARLPARPGLADGARRRALRRAAAAPALHRRSTAAVQAAAHRPPRPSTGRAHRTRRSAHAPHLPRARDGPRRGRARGAPHPRRAAQLGDPRRRGRLRRPRADEHRGPRRRGRLWQRRPDEHGHPGRGGRLRRPRPGEHRHPRRCGATRTPAPPAPASAAWPASRSPHPARAAWEVLAAGLAGGTLVLTATGVLAAGRRRAPRARTVA